MPASRAAAATADARAGSTAPSAPTMLRATMSRSTSSGLRKTYGQPVVLAGLDMTVRIGEVVALLGPERLGQEHAASLHQPSRGLGCRYRRVGGRRLGFQRRRQAAVAARHRQ